MIRASVANGAYLPTAQVRALASLYRGVYLLVERLPGGEPIPAPQGAPYGFGAAARRVGRGSAPHGRHQRHQLRAEHRVADDDGRVHDGGHLRLGAAGDPE